MFSPLCSLVPLPSALSAGATLADAACGREALEFCESGVDVIVETCIGADLECADGEEGGECLSGGGDAVSSTGARSGARARLVRVSTRRLKSHGPAIRTNKAGQAGALQAAADQVFADQAARESRLLRGLRACGERLSGPEAPAAC